MGLFDLFKPASKSVLVVDALALNESMGMKGKVPPRSQLQVLRRLARFAQREKLEMVAVLTGAPLNKAPAGKKFEDITVVYSDSPENHAKCLAKVAASKGSGAILVSGNDGVEKAVGSSVKKMRMSTFRKAFDTGNDGMDGEDRPVAGENNTGRSRGPRPPRRRQQKSRDNNNNQQNEPKPPREEKPMSDADAINELIDLVD